MRVLAAGYQMHLPKPVEPVELINAVVSLVDRFTRCDAISSDGEEIDNQFNRNKEPVMSEDIKQSVDTNSAAFKGGIQAGLKSPEDTKNWKAGNELGQELKEEVEIETPVDKELFPKTSVPLFLRDGPESEEGNPQDEKDETEE